ncbi:hypothetical protein LCGC14_2088570 [marine sediment metagenome]|uniref:Cell wall hydrolase SleB domain-containing protein n=1 Tax=marine sediment metagenome TaxID=412755 RepID=A0A0F9EDN9_9ZZZZ
MVDRPLDDMSELEVMGRTLWVEVRGELIAGKIGVANVIMNRVARGGWWGDTIKKVCLFPFAFSGWNKNDVNYEALRKVAPNEHSLIICRTVAEIAAMGALKDTVEESCHYHDNSIGFPASWGPPKEPVKIIGRLKFYNNVR